MTHGRGDHQSAVLVIGGYGFLGAAICHHFLELGWIVSVLDHRHHGGDGNARRISHYRLPWDDLTALTSLLAACHYQLVIHLGCRGMPEPDSPKALDDALATVRGSCAIIDACALYGVPRLLFASSGGTVYGFAERLPIIESAPTVPVSAHGRAKLTVEAHLRAVNSTFGISYAALRVGNAYGARQASNRTQGIVAILIGNLLRGAPIVIRGSGTMVRDYIHIDDVVSAFAAAAASEAIGCFNIGTGVGTSVLGVIALIEQALGKKFAVTTAELSPVDPIAIILDPGKALRELDWRATIPFPEGIVRTVAWYKRCGEVGVEVGRLIRE